MSKSCIRNSILTLTLLSTIAPAAFGQCDLLIRDSFRGGPRPHGGNGRDRDAQIHDALKDYWPQVPNDGTRWISADQSGIPTWIFAGSSTDPAEVDPLDPYNGTAFGDAGASAWLAFSAPSTPFTISAEVVQLFGSTSATYLGYSSSSATAANFETFGAIWISLNGRGEWALHANGNSVIASGTAPMTGTLQSGWEHVEFTFDPATSTVWGRVMDTPIAPVAVQLTTPIAFCGMEAHESWNVVNNLSVFKGTSLQIQVQGPASVQLGGNAHLAASTNAADPAAFFWTHNGILLEDGPQSSGATITGAHTAALDISNFSALDQGEYACIVTNACSLRTSASVTLTVCVADFNADGTVDFFDYLDFVDAFSSGLPTADFNKDQVIDFFDYLDFVDAFSIGC